MNRKILDCIKKDEVYAIIPARAGSKGVKNKNIKCLAGYPLIAYSIAAAKLCPEISRIIVTTDSERYAAIANFYGAETPFLRPAEISGDRATDLEFMMHAIDWFYENEGSNPEYYVHLRPTSPNRDVELITEAIKRIKAVPEATCLRSSHLASDKPYKWFNMTEEGYYKCLWDDMKIDQANNPRQSFPEVYIPDGHVDVLRTAFIAENELMHGDRALGFVVPDSVDIDFASDFDKISGQLSNGVSPILEYLKNNFRTLEEINV